ncbi:MAG TPA: hypothetical protein VEH76_14550 [Methylocystis sp.]|nr:hypothetical protein [Methylocystis sp.]
MKKLSIATALCLVAYATSAAAETKIWQVTEETDAGIKYGQGSWKVTKDGDKVSGTAEIMDDVGNVVTYKLDGTFAGTNYTVNLVDRSDKRKGCVWNGHTPSPSGVQTKGLAGWAQCEGVKIIIRAYD